jgi:hypothetical protein
MSSLQETRPELKWIDVHQMFIEKSYQRSTASGSSRRNIARLVEDFSWAQCGALTVTYVPDSGKYAVIDGQHRLAAALERGDIHELPCVVVDGMDITARADSFVGINKHRVNMNSLAKYHASVAAGDPDAVALDGLLKECGLEVSRSPVLKGDTAPNQVQSPQSLLKLLGNTTRKQMIWALTAIPEAYGEERGQMRASLIKTIVQFIKHNPEADRAVFIAALRELDPVDLEKSARSYREINGGTTVDAMMIALDRYYKKAARKRGAS